MQQQLRQDLAADTILTLILSNSSGLMIYIDTQHPTPGKIAACITLMEQACIAAVVP